MTCCAESYFPFFCLAALGLGIAGMSGAGGDAVPWSSGSVGFNSTYSPNSHEVTTLAAGDSVPFWFSVSMTGFEFGAKESIAKSYTFSDKDCSRVIFEISAFEAVSAPRFLRDCRKCEGAGAFVLSCTALVILLSIGALVCFGCRYRHGGASPVSQMYRKFMIGATLTACLFALFAWVIWLAVCHSTLVDLFDDALDAGDEIKLGAGWAVLFTAWLVLILATIAAWYSDSYWLERLLFVGGAAVPDVPVQVLDAKMMPDGKIVYVRRDAPPADPARPQ